MIIKPKQTVIKNKNTKLSGKIRLDCGTAKQCLAPQKPFGTDKIAAKNVTVLETTKDYVLLEIGCECGNAIKLKCNYADFFND